MVSFRKALERPSFSAWAFRTAARELISWNQPVQLPFLVAFDAGVPVPRQVFLDGVYGIRKRPALLPKIPPQSGENRAQRKQRGQSQKGRGGLRLKAENRRQQKAGRRPPLAASTPRKSRRIFRFSSILTACLLLPCSTCTPCPGPSQSSWARRDPPRSFCGACGCRRSACCCRYNFRRSPRAAPESTPAKGRYPGSA